MSAEDKTTKKQALQKWLRVRLNDEKLKVVGY